MHTSRPIRILSTGGTFNKIYDPRSGALVIDPDAQALRTIARRWLTDFTIETRIGKDSLEMDDTDRHTLLHAVREAAEPILIIIHGTDTMDLSADLIAAEALDKRIIFTGAMVPWSIDPIEATANVAAAIGYARADTSEGVFVAMNGCFGLHTKVIKDRSLGRFVCR